MRSKTLEELMAAIGENSDAAGSSAAPSAAPSTARGTVPSPAFGPNATPIAMPPVPIPQVMPAASRSRSAASSSSADIRQQNVNELIDLFKPPTSATQPAVPPNHVAQYPVQQMPLMPPAPRQLPQQNLPTAHLGTLDATALANYRRKQASAAKAMQKREQVMAAASMRVPAPGLPVNRPADRAGGLDIAAEISALQKSSASGARAQGSRASMSSSSARHQRPNTSQQGSAAAIQPQSNPLGGQPPSNAPGGHPPNPQSRQQKRQITQEQIIVGHFCRHAIKTLSRVMGTNPLRQQTEARLKEHIKSVWAAWVKEQISRQNLLESVAAFVRGSCPEAHNIDVIKEFKVWYEREFELQKRRTAAEQERLRAAQQQQQQNQSQQMQQNRQLQQPQQAQLPKQQRKGPSSRSQSGGSSQAHGQASSARPRTSHGKAGLNVKQSAKVEPQIGTSASLSASGGSPFVGEVQFPQGNRTGGKSISSKTVASRKTPATKGSKGPGVKAGASKGVANKSVGGKSIPRPPPGFNKGQVGIKGPAGAAQQKGPASSKAMSVAGSKGLVGGKGVAGSKGLVGNKGPSVPKGKGQRKPAAKPPSKAPPKAPPKGTPKPPPKALLKGSPKGAAKQKLSPTAPGLTSPVAPTVSVPLGGKRPLDMSASSPSGSVLKKSKPAPKGPKGNAGRKKNVPVPSGPIAGKGIKPPPARPEMIKGRPPAGPNQVSTVAVAGSAIGMKTTVAGPVSAAAAQANQPRKVKRVDDELSVVHNVVDIENEEDMLGRDAGAGTSDVIEILDYDSDMLLAGPALRSKMQATAKRFGLDENITKDAMEMMSLAVRERLATVLEKLKGIASVRVESNRVLWNTEASGPNVYEKLKQMRQDEERSLQVAAEMRVKRKKEQEEKEAKKLAGEAAQEEKKAKDSSAAAEAERKEKVALEKKRKENSSQRDALSGLLAGFDKRRKRPSSTKGLAPLGPLGKLPAIAGSRSSGSGLPPIPRRPGSEGVLGVNKDLRKLDTLEKLQVLGPVVKLGGPKKSSMPGSDTRPDKAVVKRRLTLRDCIFLMESEHNTRKGSLLYKWYARLGVRK